MVYVKYIKTQSIGGLITHGYSVIFLYDKRKIGLLLLDNGEALKVWYWGYMTEFVVLRTFFGNGNKYSINGYHINGYWLFSLRYDGSVFGR